MINTPDPPILAITTARRLAVLITTLHLSLAFTASAEFRAYELKISNSQKGSERKIVSTLDHIQYPDYHPLATGETISYVTSWMCWDRTNHLNYICPNPNISRVPASVPKPKIPGS